MTNQHLFIRVDANMEIGIGHIMRCIALAQAWKKHGGGVTFISSCKNQELTKRIGNEGFRLEKIEKPYPSNDDVDVTLRIINETSNSYSWLVLDGYHFDTEYQRRIKKSGHLLLVIDDMAHLKHYLADIIVNQNINAKDLNYSTERLTKLLLGTKYVLLRDEFLEYKRLKRKISNKARKILVTLGGSDNYNVSLKVVRALDLIEEENIEIKLIVGAANTNIATLKRAANNSRHRIILLRNSFMMPDLIAWADLAISAAGSTSWELAFMGLPTILIVCSNNQRLIAKGLNDYGSAINLGYNLNIDYSKIAYVINKISIDRNIRKEMNEKGRALIDGIGSNRVIMKIIN